MKTLDLTVKELPKTGDRDDFQITINSAGAAPIQFPLSMSGTISAVWGNTPQESALRLGQVITTIAGTVNEIPQQGFSFNSYNAENTVEDTVLKINNFGFLPFIKNQTLEYFLKTSLAHDLFVCIEVIDRYFVDKYNQRFFRTFDDAFETSEKVIREMGIPPKDNANFLYRVCILSNIVDHINVRNKNENEYTKPIDAFENWLEVKLKRQSAQKLVKTFRMVKYLRNQYPLHDHFELKNDGRFLKQSIAEGCKYFNIVELEAYSSNWGNIQNKFMETLKSIIDSLEEFDKKELSQKSTSLVRAEVTSEHHRESQKLK